MRCKAYFLEASTCASGGRYRQEEDKECSEKDMYLGKKDKFAVRSEGQKRFEGKVIEFISFQELYFIHLRMLYSIDSMHVVYKK